MANKPTKAEYEGFKKAVENPMTPAPIKQKLQSIIDQYASEYEGATGETTATKTTRGRKPSATAKKYKTLPTPENVMLVTATNEGIEKAKNSLKKMGYNPEEVDNLTGNEAFAILKSLEGKTPVKRKSTKTSSTGKKSVSDIEKAKAEIKAKTGKTEEECQAIIEQYRALRTKAQEGKRKAQEASATNKKRVEKLERKGDIIEGTTEKTADAVIETTTQDVAEKIEKQIEAVEATAEKEAKAEVAKDNTKKTPTQKKQAVEAKVEKKVKEKTKVIVKKVVIDTSALLTSIATSLGKFDKDSQKEFLIKLRSDIDKLLSKYAFGGMTDGAVQTMNIQQSNLSSSSVNPTMFANGGGIMADGRIVLRTFNGVGGNKNKTYKLIKDDRDSDGKPYYTLIEDQSGNIMAQGYSFEEVNGYANLMSGKFAKGGGVSNKDVKIRIDSINVDVYEDSYEEGEGKFVNSYTRTDFKGELVSPHQLIAILHDELDLSNDPRDYSIYEGVIFTSQLVDRNGGKAFQSEIERWKKGDFELFSENTNVRVSIVHPTEVTDEELSKLTGIGLYKKGGKVKISKKFAKGGGVDDKIKVDSLEQQVYHYSSGDTWDLKEYPSRNNGSIKEWMGTYPLSVEDVKGYILEIAGDEALDYEDEIESARTIEELVDILYENDFANFKRDNTYNSSWWGGVVETGVLFAEDADGDYYQPALVFVSFHRGGDVRGNYTEYQAFYLDSYAEEFPVFGSSLNYTIKTPKGTLSLDTQDMEGYTLSVVSDETGTFEEGDDVTIDELGEKFDFGKNYLYAKGGMTEHGLRVGDKIIGSVDSRDEIWIVDNKRNAHVVNLDKGNRFAKGGGIKGVVVYDNEGETFDRYTIFTPDGSVFGMSDNATMPNGFNMYIGDDTEIEKGSHLGKRLKSIPKSIEKAVMNRLNETYAKGGSISVYNLRKGDKIKTRKGEIETIERKIESGYFTKESDYSHPFESIEFIERPKYAKGGKLWIDTKTKGGLKGVKPSRKNSFRKEAEKRGLTSGQLASKVIANPNRYKGINPKSAQLVKNMGVRKHGGSIGDILRNRRGQ